jgi:hypothetical protein
VPKQRAHSDIPLAVLRELRPVGSDLLVEIQPAARVGHRQRHRGEALGRGKHRDEGVLLPRRAGFSVADSSPQIHHLAPALKHRARRAKLAAFGKIQGKRLAHRLEDKIHSSTDDFIFRTHISPHWNRSPGMDNRPS